MLKPRIIVCLDYENGRVVKGIRFGSLRDVGCPGDLAAAYERQGADEIVMLDVSATRQDRLAARATIEQVRRDLSI
ncbi:MAG: imidazole glycerol phosphate synthase subunit HisF, partial [Proteobacteria bacterium]|nr:imidazole glycerol phosphate synthase subunit HisF [Pseudomonadota bacterium]